MAWLRPELDTVECSVGNTCYDNRLFANGTYRCVGTTTVNRGLKVINSEVRGLLVTGYDYKAITVFLDLAFTFLGDKDR